MSEILAVALVCAASLLAKDCSRDTALDVIVSPVRTPMECMMHAQATAAAAGFPGGEGRYLKIACERRHAGIDAPAAFVLAALAHRP